MHGRRRSLALAGALLVALFVAGAVATIAGQDLGEGRRAASAATDSPEASPATRPGPRDRVRVRAAHDGVEPARSATADEIAAAQPMAGDEPAPETDPAAGRSPAKQVHIRSLVPDDATLRAGAESDPLRQSDPTRMGAPAAMPLSVLLERGIDAVDGAAELVGPRRPELEEGEAISLTGRVVDAETGRPVAGARIVVTSTFYVRRHLYDHHLREVARAFTDDDGEFAVPRLDVDPAHFGRGGRLHVTVSADGHVTARAHPVAGVRPGATSRLPDVRLARAPHSLSGRLLDTWNGAPIAGARIHATGSVDPVAYPKDQRAALFLGAPSAVTDEDGRFELTGLAPGSQVVSAHGGDDCLGRATFVVPREGEVTLRTRGIRGRIEGTVVDARGEPVPLVAVRGGGNSTHSFADGSFVLENFREPRLSLSFSHPDYRREIVRDVEDGTAQVLVRMEHRRPEVRLRIVRADDGAPVTEIRVVARAAEGAALQRTSPVHIAASGVHVLRVPEGAAVLTISASGLVAQDVDATNLRDGDALDVLLAPE